MNKKDSDFIEVVESMCPDLKHIVEVGVFEPKDCSVAKWVIDPAVRVQLFEPQPHLYDKLLVLFGESDNVDIHSYAIADDWGQAVLNIPPVEQDNPDAGASAYLDIVHNSPFRIRTGSDLGMQDSVRVETAPFHYFDDGTIDAIHIDTEGCEWYVIKHMISRPVVISVEIGGPNGYRNEHEKEIFAWLEEEGYIKDREVSVEQHLPDGSVLHVVCDMIFVKEGKKNGNG